MKLFLLFTGILAKRKSSRTEFTTDFPFDLITDYTTELPADFVTYFAADSSTDSQTDEDLEQEGFTTDYPANITSSTEAPISSTTIPTSTSSTATSTTRTTATSTTETSTRSTISTTTSPEGSSGDSSDNFTTEYPSFGSEDFTTDSLVDFTSPSEETSSSTLSTLTSTSSSTTRYRSTTTESQTDAPTTEPSTESTSTSSTAASTIRTTMTSTTESSPGDFTTDYSYFGSGDYTTDSLEEFTSSEATSSSTLSTSTALSTVDSTRSPPTCLQNTAFADIFVWEIAPGMDKPSPYSNFEYEIANFAGDTQDCQRECANFAGCYKLHHDVDNNICELRGDEITFSEDGNDYAVSGKSCESGYEWIDYAVNLEFYCLFSTSKTPEDFLAMLNSYNPPGWVTYTSIGFAYSYEFAFELATNVPWLQPAGPNQIWIAFVGELHIRFENYNFSRKRRFAIPEVEVDSVVQDVAANATTEFQASIDAGNATVAITTNTTVEVEEVAPVIDPLDPTSTLAPTTTSTTTTTTTTIATTNTSTTTTTSTTTSTITTTTTRTITSTSSTTTSSSTKTTASTTTVSSNSTGTIPQLGSLYDALESVLSDAVADHPNNKLKNFYKIKARFGWFNDYVETPCANPAGAGPGIAPDFVEPTISTNDPCLAAETFYNALLGFYDDFVCLDRIRNRGITKNVDNKLDQAKDLFNRILRKTTCPLLV